MVRPRFVLESERFDVPVSITLRCKLMRGFLRNWKWWVACMILAMASGFISACRFPREFWTPATIVLVTVTFVLFATLILAVGLFVGVMLFVFGAAVFSLFIPVKKECLVDEVFGELRREGRGNERGPWIGSVAFHHKPTRMESLVLFIDSGEGRPTAAQQGLFREIEARYQSIWPQIAEALADYHERLKTVEGVEQHVDTPSLEISPVLPGQPLTWTFQYTFDADLEGEDFFNDYCSYFVCFEDWKIISVDVAD